MPEFENIGRANATGAVVRFGLDERETAIEGMILIDLRTEVGSSMRLVSSQGRGRIYPTRFLVLIAVRHNFCDRRSLQITI